MSDTATAARAAISAVETASDATPSLDTSPSTETMASRAPQIIASEVDSLRDGDTDSYTKQVAAAHTSRLDDRSWQVTPYGGARREHWAPSETSRVAREMLDLQTSQDGREVSADDKRAIAIERMIGPDLKMPAGVTRGSAAWRAILDASLAAMIAPSQERRR